MAIRIREVEGIWVALCAARSVEKVGDIYLDDAVHHALSNKFARDFNQMYVLDLPTDLEQTALFNQEESNNPNRKEWDKWMESLR